MSGNVSYESMYKLGYDDAIGDLRNYLQHIYKSPQDPITYSFNSGWNMAVDKIVEDILKWNGNGRVTA